MSHILEALQKLQDEKRGGAAPDLITGGALISHRPARKKKRFAFLGVIQVSVVAISALALAVWWYMNSAAKPDKSVAAQIASAPAVPTSPTPLPGTVPPALPVPAALAEKTSTAPLVKPSSAPAKSNKKEKAARTAKRKKTSSAAASAFVPASAPVSTMPAPTEIKVEGVAWQEDRSRRRAVINGLLVAEGTAVRGATVKEIQQNRVLFLMNGATFEVSVPR